MLLKKERVCNMIKSTRRCAKLYRKENIKIKGICSALLSEDGYAITDYVHIQINVKTGNISIRPTLQFHGKLISINGPKRKYDCNDLETIELFSKWSNKHSEKLKHRYHYVSSDKKT